jgi:polar amino acid transport system substrate-binding protein
MQTIIIQLALLLAISVLTCSIAVADVFSFTTADSQTHPRSVAMNAIVTECFNRMGHTANIHPMPSERSLYNANAGVQDGNFVRTMGISAAYPNLIAVPEPLSENVIVAFSKYPAIKVNGWESLLPYNVVWVRGWKNCDRELKEAKTITRVPNEELLFRFLSEGRADVGVFGLDTGVQKLRELAIINVHPITPPIAESTLHLYVHKSHAHLVDQISATIRAIKLDGTYKKLLDQTYQYIPSPE